MNNRTVHMVTVAIGLIAVPAFGMGANDPWQALDQHAAARHGALGERAARFLKAHRPEMDKDVDAKMLLDNLDFAIRARTEFPWSTAIPEELFLNDVLPYASMDETRENWRPRLHAVASELVKGCKTAGEAAQVLNRDLFNKLNVHYNTGRKKPNQSPAESIAQGRATCTGLSILLVDACRAVGVPARVVGVANWNGKQGNHTWVEIWDGQWFFLGADEYDRKGLNHAWFINDASRAVKGDPQHAVWASSWRSTGDHFVLAWNPTEQGVAGIDVTARYAPDKNEVDSGGPKTAASPGTGSKVLTDASTIKRYLRGWDTNGGKRLALSVAALDSRGDVVSEVVTRDGRADLNDMPAIEIPHGQSRRLMVSREGQTRIAYLDADDKNGNSTVELYWDELGLSKADAQATINAKWNALRSELARARRAEMDNKEIVNGEHGLQFLERSFGEAPENGRSLWISLHGGGGAPAEVNDKQWNNQIKLYEPDEGIYIAPRAPTNTWNLWHQVHVDGLLDRLIASFVVVRGVDPNRVFLMGYSAGGDGVFQLAPRMADRFAAASMMAGHPNETSPLGLRNLPFAIFMGGDDSAYNRNAVAREWGKKLGKLRENDPAGYPHLVKIYPNTGHWMNGNDAEALPWMAQRTRDPWPHRVVWLQDDVTHDRFYWLALEQGVAAKRQKIIAEVDGQTIRIESEDVSGVTLRLHDSLIDLDRPIKVTANGQTCFSGHVRRQVQVIAKSLAERADPFVAATAELSVNW
ncbi:MAG: transglutaminase domain-containing protein [Planctomycetota bacterium]|jgi:hypothetical protein